MRISLANRVAWITGGSEGIGRGVALLAAECGAKVAVTGRDIASLESVVETIQQTASTEAIGDGKIFVLDLASAVRIRTGESGETAL